MTPPLATCPVCRRQLVIRDGRIREHLPRESWSEKKCPGSGAKKPAEEATR